MAAKNRGEFLDDIASEMERCFPKFTGRKIAGKFLAEFLGAGRCGSLRRFFPLKRPGDGPFWD